MKRCLLWVMFGIMLAVISECNERPLTFEQSIQNFEVYTEKIQEVAEKNGCELTKESCVNNRQCWRKIILTVNEGNTGEKIEIEIANSADDSDKGVEHFYIDYTIDRTKTDKPLNIGLFTELANCVSSRELTYDFCKEFLEASESKYPSTLTDEEKRFEGIKIRKEHNFNFFEDWNIRYTLREEDEVLSFWGLTLQLEG